MFDRVAYAIEYNSRPENKAKIKAYHQTPEARAKAKERRDRPEEKANRKQYQKIRYSDPIKKAKQAIDAKKYYQKNKVKMNKQSALYRIKIGKAKQHEYYLQNIKSSKLNSKNTAIASKYKCLSYYKKGEKIECVFCKESEYEFMSLDHTDGNGAEHRRLNNYASGTPTYLWAIKNNYPPIFQVACMSCNHGRSRRGSVDGKPNDNHLAYLSRFVPKPKRPDGIPKMYNEKVKFKCFNTKTVNLIRKYRNANSRHWLFKRKIKIFTYYSKHDYIACECCGETRLVRLSLDHEKNNGGIERKKLSRGLPSGCAPQAIYQKIINENFPPGYQVQCMNCNHGRGRKNNLDHVCPHKRK